MLLLFLSGLWINKKYLHLAASPDGLIFQDQKWNNIIEVKCLNILRLNSVESIVNGDCLKAEIKRKFIITRFNCSCWWQKLTFVTLCSFFRERAFKHRKGFSWCRVAKPYNWKHPIVLGESFYSRIFFYESSKETITLCTW